jgi:thiol-disulfide isomerase/thioredoxin
MIFVFIAMVSVLLAPMAFGEEANPAQPAAAPAAKAPAPAPPAKYDKIGAGLPPIALGKVLEKGSVNLGNLGGKPALFIFMNSSCTACRAELSTLSKTAKKLAPKVTPYVVTVDFDPTSTTKRYPDITAMPYILLDGSDYKAANALGFDFTPATLVVDKTGKQVFRKGGFSGGDEMEVFKALMAVSK